MTTTTQVLQSDIPDVLKPFYAGTPAEEGKPAVPGLIERGISEIYPSGLKGAEAYQEIYKPLFQAGLMIQNYLREYRSIELFSFR